MTAFYNEIDPYAAQWLRNLIDAGHIAPGIVDERSIQDIAPDELSEFTQCHFFAGIGGWPLALRRAGWPDDRPVWTGSCPCQPFSAAGAGAGFADPRHLWPDFAWHIANSRPTVVFGEQVATKVVDAWIDLVQADLEALGYAVGAIAFPSAGVGAPHIRDRVYWVGHADDEGSQGHPWNGGTAGRQAPTGPASATGLPNQLVKACRAPAGSEPGAVNGFWRDADWLHCRDGYWRAVEAGTSPLADGIPDRVGRVRAYGNAVNVEAAHEFIAAYRDGLTHSS